MKIIMTLFFTFIFSAQSFGQIDPISNLSSTQNVLEELSHEGRIVSDFYYAFNEAIEDVQGIKSDLRNKILRAQDLYLKEQDKNIKMDGRDIIRIIWETIKPTPAEAPTHDGHGHKDKSFE